MPIKKYIHQHLKMCLILKSLKNSFRVCFLIPCSLLERHQRFKLQLSLWYTLSEKSTVDKTLGRENFGHRARFSALLSAEILSYKLNSEIRWAIGSQSVALQNSSPSKNKLKILFVYLFIYWIHFFLKFPT